MTRRNFRGINKLNEETWLSYYKKRNINYGIPVIVDTKEKLLHLKNIDSSYKDKDSYKFTFDIIENNILKCLYNSVTSEIYVLNKQHQLYSILRFISPLTNEFENKIIFLKNFNVTNIEISINNDLFVIHNKNNLYKCKQFKELYLLDKDIINIFRSYYITKKLIYTKNCGTYSVSSDYTIVKIFDNPILAYLQIGKYEYYINDKNQLHGRIFNGKKYKYRKFGLNAKQLAGINFEYFIVLGINGFISFSNVKEKDAIKIDIPNVASISENSFLTENGDLYCFGENLKPVLINTNVVNIGNFRTKRILGCYVKRYFF